MQKPLHEVLFSLMKKGFIHAESFTPIRMWLERDKIEKSAVRQRVEAQVAAATSGRWAIRRPLKPQSIEEQLNRAENRPALMYD